MKKFLFLSLVLAVSAVYAQPKVTSLLLENRVNPVGMDVLLPRFTWQLVSDKRNTVQSAYEINVTDQSQKAVWKSGKVNSDQSVHVPYAGTPLKSGQRYTWQVRVWDGDGKGSAWSEKGFWQMGLLNATDWKAKWIMSGGQEDTLQRPSPLLRKGFATTKKVQSATAYITAQGLYEASINGKRVGDALLTPGWTSYNKRLQYQQYDVTNLLTQGQNAIGVVLGSGWYRGFIGFEKQKNFYGDKIALLFQLEIAYSDGSTEVIVSDESWKSSTGSILQSEIYHGETIDARISIPNWDAPGFNDASWQAVALKQNNNVNLIATYNEPIRRHEKFAPVKVMTTPKGERVIDFGQNLVGWVKVKARGEAGTRISIYHAEVLDKKGNFYTDNLRPAKQQNVYVLAGKGDEVFEPHFTFQGFRYIKVEGYPGELKPENFEATALYSDMPLNGTFTSSHPLINKLQQNIQWGQRGNFLDVPTDCPQRDERLGWTGDAQAFARTATFNFGVNNFFAKWLRDVEADQVEGSVPFVVPNVLGVRASGSAGWADAATIIPWTMYVAYGDKRVLENQYNSMKNWVGFMERNSTNYLWNKGFHFGDWLFYRPFDDNDGRSAVTDKYLIAQCFFANSVELVVKTAKVLGKNDDVPKYEDLLSKVRSAFQKEYVTLGGRLVSGTQTAYVLSLQFDMLPESMRSQVAAKLVKNIKSYGSHLTTGFLGTPYLCHVLSRFGYHDVAYTLLMQETYPSWLYPVKMGATTIWERWDGIKPDSTFQTPGMNSFNHYAYGAIGDWMYRVVTGIDTEESTPGYKRIVVKPVIGAGLTSAAATYQTYYGKIASSWKLTDGKLRMEVEVPANTTATVHIPSDQAGVTESGKPIASANFRKTAGDRSVAVEVGSGKYVFECTPENLPGPKPGH